MKKKHIVLIILGVVIIGIAVTAFVVISNVQKNMEALKTMDITDVDLSAAKDGVYEGSYSAFPVSAKVRVTIKDRRIESIELTEHRHGKGGAAEAIPGKVVDAQSLEVDAISGATASSQVIKLAIRDALEEAQQKEF